MSDVNLQTDLFAFEPAEHSGLPDCVEYWQQVLPADAADRFYQLLRDRLSWQQPEVVVFGRSHKIPRLQYWMADQGVSYSYSEHALVAEPWLPEILTIKRKVETLTGHKFNSVLINYYRSGDDKMGWHADNEPELGVNPAVATLSLGAVRDFQFRQNAGGLNQQLYSIALAHGSVLLMKPGMQASYKHQLPPRKKVKRGRISLTFRYVYTA